jgi:hypothetical protein
LVDRTCAHLRKNLKNIYGLNINWFHFKDESSVDDLSWDGIELSIYVTAIFHAYISWVEFKPKAFDFCCSPFKFRYPRPLLLVYNQYLPFIKMIQLPDFRVECYHCSDNVYTDYSKCFPLASSPSARMITVQILHTLE